MVAVLVPDATGAGPGVIGVADDLDGVLGLGVVGDVGDDDELGGAVVVDVGDDGEVLGDELLAAV